MSFGAAAQRGRRPADADPCPCGRAAFGQCCGPILAGAVLGVVGAGGLGQMLAFHMGLFQMGETSTVLLAMLALVALVDGASYGLRKVLA